MTTQSYCITTRRAEDVSEMQAFLRLHLQGFCTALLLPSTGLEARGASRRGIQRSGIAKRILGLDGAEHEGRRACRATWLERSGIGESGSRGGCFLRHPWSCLTTLQGFARLKEIVRQLVKSDANPPNKERVRGDHG
jgi:hypothetical protein